MDSGTDKKLREMLPRPETVLPGTADTGHRDPRVSHPPALPLPPCLLALVATPLPPGCACRLRGKGALNSQGACRARWEG